MKLKKLIHKTEDFLNSEKRKRKEKKKYLKRVLNKLRAYEEELLTLLKTETDPETINKLKRKIALTHQQRKKGVKLLKELQQKNKPD